MRLAEFVVRLPIAVDFFEAKSAVNEPNALLPDLLVKFGKCLAAPIQLSDDLLPTAFVSGVFKIPLSVLFALDSTMSSAF